MIIPVLPEQFTPHFGDHSSTELWDVPTGAHVLGSKRCLR